MNGQNFGIIGFPWDGGASLGRPGARYAPQAIRENAKWLQNRIQDGKIYNVEKRQLIDFNGAEMIDLGDIDIVAYSTEKTFENAERKIGEAFDQGIFPFILGGDHSISYPGFKALAERTKGKVGIIQFDTHLDLVDDSPVQGKFSQSSQMRRALELPNVNPEHIVQIGVRSYNYPWYGQYLQETGIVQITAAEVHRMTAQDVIDKTLEALRDVEAIYLTFDIDVLDSAFAPGSGANEPGGLTPPQCFGILDGLYRHIHAMDIAEVNPLFDHQGITSGMAARILFDCATARV
ncbi:agmatinase family protein [Cohnella algarum]|uniref:agmatinase family protein n=1 Tax=Cohnella algarum TaxID=2044859 RepID=UPI00196837D1|nr:agmatinase family protein [Cohnella algarum]MBN2981237.1 agmatinase family protein [Cohnella algarum]